MCAIFIITFQVIMRRAKGDVDFDRSWAEYRKGFGNFGGDFWIGLLNIFSCGYLWKTISVSLFGLMTLTLDLDSTRIQVDALGHTSTPF